MAQPTVRPATPADAAAIAHVQVATWQAAYRTLVAADELAALDERAAAAAWRQRLRHGPGRCWVAVDEADGVVAYIAGGPTVHAPPGRWAGRLAAVRAALARGDLLHTVGRVVRRRLGGTPPSPTAAPAPAPAAAAVAAATLAAELARQYPAKLYALYVLPTHQQRGLGHALLRALVQHLQAAAVPAMLVYVMKGSAAVGFYEALGARFLHERPAGPGDHGVPALGYGWPELARLAEALRQ